MRSFFIRFILIFPFFTACRQSPNSSDNYMAFDEVVYIDKFPRTFTLQDGKVLKMNVLGARSMAISGSHMIISSLTSSGYWSFFSLPEFEYKGKYLIKGNGPNELLSMPRVGKQYLFEEEGQQFAVIYDFERGRLYKMNISETLDITDSACMRSVIKYLALYSDSQY